MGKSLARWIADNEIWPLCAGVSLATFTPRYAPAGLGLILILWFVRWYARGTPIVRSPADLPALVLLATAGISCLITADREATFVGASRLIAGIALTYGIIHWARRPAHLSLLGFGMMGLGLAVAVLTPLGIEWPFGYKIPHTTPMPLFTLSNTLRGAFNANMLAGALLMLLPFPLAILVFSAWSSLPLTAGALPRPLRAMLDTHGIRFLFCILSLSATAAALFLTGSRGGWAGAGAALLVVMAGRWAGWAVLLPVGVAVAGISLWRADVLTVSQRFLVTSAAGSFGSRLRIWERALFILRDFPLTGAGIGMFGKAVDWLYPVSTLSSTAHYPHTHNLFLQVGVDLGIPGLLGYAALLAAAFWSVVSSIRRFSREDRRGMEALAWACLASLAGMTFHGMFDATTWVVGKGCFIPFAVMGLVFALAKAPARRHAGLATDCLGQ
ncbi:MAG: O-antigen ligase family protein [Anaerolineae bacterium]